MDALNLEFRIRRSYYGSNGVGAELSRLAELSLGENLLPQKNLLPTLDETKPEATAAEGPWRTNT